MNRLTAIVTKTRTLAQALSKAALFLGMGWVVVMMLLTTFDVAGRTLFSRPIPGSIELGEFMLAIFGVLGMAYTHFAGANVKVTMLTDILPAKLRNVIELITSALSLGIMGMLSWQGGVLAIEEMHMGTTTDNLSLPTFPVYWLLSIGAGLLSLVILVCLLEHLLAVFGIDARNQATAGNQAPDF